jgi:hypothetical protein
MTLRAKRVAALRASLKGCHLSLNLRGHDLLLQAREQRFAFCYSQSHCGRRDFLRPLDDPQFVFDGAAWDRIKYQLNCPFHSQRLIQPTTLHTLERNRLKGVAGDALNAILGAAAMNFQKLLGAFWRIFLHRLMRIWGWILVLQRSSTLQTPSAHA